MEDRKPWPWKVETIEFRKKGITRLEMRMNNCEMSRRVCDMIESAPEMYEALKVLAEDAEKAVNPAARLFNYAQVKAALAKADGKTEAA